MPTLDRIKRHNNGLITKLRSKVREQEHTIALLRRVLLAARKYANTGDDTALLRALELEGWEEPPRRAAPRPKPTAEPVPEGRSFRACEGYELI